MIDGHCFISYSTADAQEFAVKLADELEGGYPHINVWFDKRDLRPGMEWDIQIDDGLSSCKLVLFVMTKDSTNEKSVCKQEWSRALSYKKTVIPLLLHQNIHTPFRLGDRQRIDFTGNFEAGVAQLRRHLAWMDSPSGELQAFKDRLSDAERDLQRAKEVDKPRIKAEIDELNEQIKRQVEIVKNPKAAEQRTEDNIQSGLERERQPEKPVAGKTSTRFINPPPGIAPNYFQDRFVETKQIVDFLNNDSQRLMTIVGRAGVGKTAMVCRLLKTLERGELPDDLGEMKADGIVYLSETGSHRVNFANVFADLSKLLPPSEETAERLEGIYKNPQTSTGDKMRALLDGFPSGRVILLLDNFESLFDPESQNPRDSELSEALNALLGGPHHAVKAIITTRIAPHDLAISEPGRQRHLRLDEGLESPYAENVLREIDADGRVGLKTASDAVLNKAREKTRGFPKALVAIYGILSVDRYTTLEELLDLPILPENVVEAYVGEAFNRLDPSAQKVMQALAVYNRPVSPAAIDYLLQPHLPSIDSALVLNRLVNMHFARREAGRYYLHPADKEYAFSIIPQKDLTTKEDKKESSPSLHASRIIAFTQHELLSRAADFFAQTRKPRTEWKKLEDLSAQLAEFELRCEAGDYDAAADVLTDIDFNYLLLWGHYRLMIEMHLLIKDKITDTYLGLRNLNGLGLAHQNIGKVIEAIDYYQQGLDNALEAKNRGYEGAFLGNLGNTHNDLGEPHKAIDFYEQALVIAREIRDRKGEGTRLGNLGSTYFSLGEVHKSIEFYEQALVIAREIHNRISECANLDYLGSAYDALDEAQKAIEYFEQALTIAYEIGDRKREGILLGNIAEERINLGEYELAIQSAEQYVKICEEISKPASYALLRLAQAYLYKTEFIKAREAVDSALKYDEPKNNHNVTTLHGIIALRQGGRGTAQEAFMKSIAQADEILAKTPDFYEALDAKGLALCGSAVSGEWTVGNSKERDEVVAEAMETFSKARKIAPHAGVVKRVLRLFDELVKCDEEGILKDVRNAVEGVE